MKLLGLLIPLAALLPNFFFFAGEAKNAGPVNKPADEPPAIKMLTAFERVGQIGCFTIPAFFEPTIDSPLARAAFALMVFALVLYYCGWVRYFRGNRERKLLFAPYLGIPAAMAVLPVVYFLSSAAVLQSWYMFIAAVLLAVGHIPVAFHDHRQTIHM